MGSGALAAIIVAAVVGGLALVSLGSGLVLFFVMFGRNMPMSLAGGSGKKLMGAKLGDYVNYIRTNAAELKKNPYQPVQVVSARGKTLTGYFFPVEGSKKTALCMHGYRSSAFADFAAISRSYLREGYNVLLVNHEGHGDSEGNFIGFGVLDRENTEIWCLAINKLVPNGEIVLHGISMGAATCLTSSELPLTGVKAVVADCGFSSPREVFEAVRRTVVPYLPSFPMVPIAEAITKLCLKFDFHTVTAQKSAANSRYPLLILHGDADTFVPCEMAQRIYESAAEPKELKIFAGAAHAASHMAAPEEYEKTLFAFLNRYLGDNGEGENGI